MHHIINSAVPPNERFRENLGVLISNISTGLDDCFTTMTIKKISYTPEQSNLPNLLNLASNFLKDIDSHELISTFILHTYVDWGMIKNSNIRFLYKFSQDNFIKEKLPSIIAHMIDLSFLFYKEDDKICTRLNPIFVDGIFKCFRYLVMSSVKYLYMINTGHIRPNVHNKDILSLLKINPIQIHELVDLWIEVPAK